VTSCTAPPLYTRVKIPRCSLGRRPQSRSGYGVLREKSLPIQGIELRSSIPHLVTIHTDLPYVYVYHMYMPQYVHMTYITCMYTDYVCDEMKFWFT
jgi:hypothetical protein